MFFAFDKGMTIGEAKSMYDYLGKAKTLSKINGQPERDLKVFDILRDDLKYFTGNFCHQYGFTKLVRYKPKKRNLYR